MCLCKMVMFFVLQESSLLCWLKEWCIIEVECLVLDIIGNVRGKIIFVDKFLYDYGMCLLEGIFVIIVIGEFFDDYYELILLLDLDMMLCFDLDMVCMVLWVVDVIVQVIYDCYIKSGELYEFVLCNVLCCVLVVYVELGLCLVVVFELEFFLVQKNIDFDFLLLLLVGCLGCLEIVWQLYLIDVVNEFDLIFDLMYDYVDVMKLDVDMLIYEFGVVQLEVNFIYVDVMDLVDQVFLFKCIMCEVVMCYGVYVMFLVKLMENELGSVMYIYQSLVWVSDGSNVFVGEIDVEGEFSLVFGYYLGGLQKYVLQVMVFFVLNVNFYCWLVFGEVLLSNVYWGFDNCICGLCVLLDILENMCVESWFVGFDVNLYLVMVVILVCGLFGICEWLVLDVLVIGSVKELGYNLLCLLGEVLDGLEQCSEFQVLLGECFCCVYILVKCKEYEIFFCVISLWECEFLLLNV